jgi:hypothetical protein
MSKGALGGRICFAAAFALLAVAAWHAYRIIEPAITWKPAQAKASATEVRYKHDGQAFAVFYIFSKLTYEAAGQRIETEGVSDFETHEFADAKALEQQIRRSGTVQVYWNGANPKQARFGLAYDELFGSNVSGLVAAAFLLLLSGRWLQRNWLPLLNCAQCGKPVERYYRYCPHCRAATSSAAP